MCLARSPDRMGLDLRAALRSIARSPGFFLGAVLTLALGLGAVTTAFGLLAGALGDSRNRPICRSGRALPDRTGRTAAISGCAGRMRASEHLRECRAEFQSHRHLYHRHAESDRHARVGAESTSNSSRLNTSTSSRRAAARSSGRAVRRRHRPRDRHQPRDVAAPLWRRRRRRLANPLDPVARAVDHCRRDAGGFRGLSGRAEAFVPHTMSPRVSFARYFTSRGVFPQRHRHAQAGRRSQRSAQSELSVIAARMAADRAATIG